MAKRSGLEEVLHIRYSVKQPWFENEVLWIVRGDILLGIRVSEFKDDSHNHFMSLVETLVALFSLSIHVPQHRNFTCTRRVTSFEVF